MFERKAKVKHEKHSNHRNAEGEAATSDVVEISAAGAEAQAAADAAEAGAAQQAAGQAGPSQVEFDQVKGERDQLMDRLARLQAEFDNARKRQEREKQEFRDYATGNVVEQFLPVLDNFSLALKSQGSAEQLRQGVELIIKQMEEVLRNLNVTPVATVGEAFDPHQHEALGQVDRDDMPDHHIADEIRKGYRIRERLLRPALVRVVNNPNQKSE